MSEAPSLECVVEQRVVQTFVVRPGPRGLDPSNMRARLSEAIERLTAIRDGLPQLEHSPRKCCLAFAKLLYKERRLRDRVLGQAELVEPRWDVLLDLFIAREEGREIPVSSACIAANVPATTALRHLQLMEVEGVVERAVSDQDKRVRLVSLSDAMHRQMLDLLMRMLVMRQAGLD